MHRYTKDMPLDQRLARHALDIASHVFCCHSRHEERVAQRIAHGRPPRHADKVHLEQQQAAQREVLGGVIRVALMAHDQALERLAGEPAEASRLQRLAENAVRALADQAFIANEAVQAFRDAASPYVDDWRSEWPEALPQELVQFHLCRAAIGQAFIDDGIARPEGARAGAAITPEGVEAWFYD
jgi:hypothetical protein